MVLCTIPFRPITTVEQTHPMQTETASRLLCGSGNSVFMSLHNASIVTLLLARILPRKHVGEPFNSRDYSLASGNCMPGTRESTSSYNYHVSAPASLLASSPNSNQSMEWIGLKRSSPVRIHELLILIQSNPADYPEYESSPVQSGHNRVGIYQIPCKIDM